MKTQKIQLVLTAVISAAVGGAASTLVYAKIQEAKFQERLSKEIAEAKEFYQNMYSTPVLVMEEEKLSTVVNVHEDVEEPRDIVGDALNAARSYSPNPDPETDNRELTIVNVFQNHVAPGEEVLAALMKDRDPAEPYIITRQEFLENEPDYEQVSFTFWEGDTVLVDDREELNPIDDTERVVGDENLLRFGYGSGDENVLYVRNETLDPPMDLHITKSSGKYSNEVMGLDDADHLQHSQPRKFRIRDE